MAKKKVLMLATTAAMIEQFNKSNIDLLVEMGYEVHMAGNFKEGNPISEERLEQFKGWMAQRGGKCFDITLVRNPIDIKKNGNAFRRLLSLIREYKYEFIHCHTPVGAAIGRMVAHRTHTPIIYTAHGLHFYTGAPLKNWLLYYPIEKFLSKWTDNLILINEEDYQRAKKKFHAKKTSYIPGVGVDTKKINPNNNNAQYEEIRKKKRKELGIQEEKFVLMTVGELIPRKNHQVLIRAMSKIKDDKNIKLIICGQGPLYDELNDMIQQLEVEESVQLLGFRNDIRELSYASDAFVFPSIQEGLSMAMMEALAAGLPVIASDIRGNHELVDGNGILCVKNQIGEYVEAIKYIKSMQDKHMKERSLEIIQQYDINVVKEKMMKIYKDF